MDITKEDAILVLRKWLDERTRVKILLEGTRLRVSGTGWLMSVTDGEIEIALGLDNRNDALSIALSLEAVRMFEFVDPHEANPSIREEAVTSVSSILAMTFSASTGCMIFELR